MSNVRSRYLYGCCALLLLGAADSVSALERAPAYARWVGSRSFAYKYAPRVVAYDLANDRLVHQHSVLAPEPVDRPGGNLSYYGSRLTTFRFRGPRRQAGMYEAFDEYKRGLDLDERNYQYRHRP